MNQENPIITVVQAAPNTHPGGVQGALCDGSVRFLSETINLDTLKHLAARDDGIPLTGF